jgi:hypothetical protein
VIAPSGMATYDGTLFPAWRGAFIVGGLVSQGLVVLRMENDRVAAEERISLGARVRDVRVGPDGAVYALTETRGGGPSRIVRIAPKGLAGRRSRSCGSHNDASALCGAPAKQSDASSGFHAWDALAITGTRRAPRGGGRRGHRAGLWDTATAVSRVSAVPSPRWCVDTAGSTRPGVRFCAPCSLLFSRAAGQDESDEAAPGAR